MHAGQLLPPRSPPVPLPEATHFWGPASALAISVLPGLGPGWIFRAHLNALFHLILSPSRGDLERDLLPRLRGSCLCLCLASLECPSSRQCPRCSGLVAGLGQVHVGTRRGPPFCVSRGSIESSQGRTPPAQTFTLQVLPSSEPSSRGIRMRAALSLCHSRSPGSARGTMRALLLVFAGSRRLGCDGLFLSRGTDAGSELK